MSGPKTSGEGRKRSRPWGRLCLGVVGGYLATTLCLAALALIPGLSLGERVNWGLLLAPLIATLFLAYPFIARSLANAARNMVLIALASGAALLLVGTAG